MSLVRRAETAIIVLALAFIPWIFFGTLLTVYTPLTVPTAELFWPGVVINAIAGVVAGRRRSRRPEVVG